MAITYPLTWPANKAPRSVTFSAINAVTFSRSVMSYDTQVQEYHGQAWGIDVSLPPMEREDAEPWVAFLLKLRGPRGTFYAYDPLAVLPRGVATGNPKVKGGSQVGNTLATDGWDPDVTGILLAGDRIQVGARLYAVMNDANTNGSGEVTLDIWPRLRESPADNETIITVRPKGIFRLASNQTPLWSADETRIYDISFQAVEAI